MNRNHDHVLHDFRKAIAIRLLTSERNKKSLRGRKNKTETRETIKKREKLKLKIKNGGRWSPRITPHSPPPQPVIHISTSTRVKILKLFQHLSRKKTKLETGWKIRMEMFKSKKWHFTRWRDIQNCYRPFSFRFVSNGPSNNVTIRKLLLRTSRDFGFFSFTVSSKYPRNCLSFFDNFVLWICFLILENLIDPNSDWSFQSGSPSLASNTPNNHLRTSSGPNRLITVFSPSCWGAKGVWRARVVSMITKCRSDHRSDPNVLEWETRFILGLNAAINTDYIEKWSEQKLFRTNFPTKYVVDANLYLHQEWS